MAEFFCELFSEEIPARMQARAADDLARLLSETLAALQPHSIRLFHGPRRIAIAATLADAIPANSVTERGPRVTAPEAARQGFLRKHGAQPDALRQEGDFWVLDRATPAQAAAELIAAALPALLRRFPWPKSMRWGGTSAFTWIRPLRRICCLLDGAAVPFTLAVNDDDGHGLRAGNETEGHRGHAPGAFAVHDVQDWIGKLRDHHVVADAAERQRLVADGVAARAASVGVAIVADDALVAEVAGLVEWPVALLGRIDAAFMDLPPEVMQVSMRVNQRYFATRTADGAPAPYFAFVANIDAADGGRAIVAGNERVLRARFADARHFWDLDRRTKLADRVAALDGVTFHAALGTQGARVRRLVALAGVIADAIGAPRAAAERAALLAKADLTTGMVGEFPELQGVMGGYYARHDGEDDAVADAVRDHYTPKGPADAVPANAVSVALALADRLDQLAAFFAIGEKPTGSGDPYALRRAALGVIRLVRDNGLRVGLRGLARHAALGVRNDVAKCDPDAVASEVLAFIAERLRVQSRTDGARHDVLAAVNARADDDDIVRVLARTQALAAFLATEDGGHLLAAYKRAANILRIEEKRDGPHDEPPDPAGMILPEEQELFAALQATDDVDGLLAREMFAPAMTRLAQLRAPLDAFFEKVTVNAEDAALRVNRLRILAAVRQAMNRVADFAAIEN
jgi:glycyl-tRNA synthetase beta chain